MDVFERVMCGIDSSRESLAAVRQAARVADPQGDLALVAVDDRSLAAEARRRASAAAPAAGTTPAAALVQARAEAVRPVETVLLVGSAIDRLLAEIAARDVTLAVVGSHGRTRAAGVTIGSVATFLVHEARCSVLVARETEPPERWPRSIVVGVDGSRESKAAARAARALAARLGAGVRTVVAMPDAGVDLEEAHRIAPNLEEHRGNAVDVLAHLSAEADLVVVGNRSLRGMRSLMSVSEQLAHAATSSVLVVRP